MLFSRILILSQYVWSTQTNLHWDSEGLYFWNIYKIWSLLTWKYVSLQKQKGLIIQLVF